MKKTIKVDYLARVEGEGALYIDIKDDQVEDVKLKIFEPPRFFEALLRGRKFTEAPDITARICGICPVAYQMSAVHAMENALGITVSEPIRQLRRLLYCGEWIESHGLHVYMLHAPDFLGYEDAIQMAKDHPEAVKRGLRLKKAGNSIVTLVGGREIHPINVKVGGFFKIPAIEELQSLAKELEWARDAAEETVKWVSKFNFPEFTRDYEYVALRHDKDYPFNQGKIISNRGLKINANEYDDHFSEQHIAHSNALHSVLNERGSYMVGPLARYSLNFDLLPENIKNLAFAVGLKEVCHNPFRSIIVRSIEILYACEEALRIIREFKVPDSPAIDIEPCSATGYACTEAPRGILYHRYRVNDKGIIEDAKIVPPTSQNQKTIEEDLAEFVPKYISLSQDELVWHCEQAVRNYDPCISCATHFLKLNIKRE